MAQREPLNPRQVQVLQWVADGCPDGQWSDSKYKTTAAALQSRRLITVSKRGGAWTAEIEPAGQHYLDHGAYPPDHFEARRQPVIGKTKAMQAGVTAKRVTVVPMPMTGVELLTRLRTEGTVTIASPKDGLRAAWRRTINAAQVSDELRPDEQVTFNGRDSGDLVITLGTKPAKRPERPAVPTIRGDAPWPKESQQFAKQPGLIKVSEGSRARALGIVHRLAIEISHRGYRLEPRADNEPGFRLARFGFTQDYDISEEYEDAEVVPEEELASKKYSWQRVSLQVRRVPTGRLTISYGTYSRRSWADRKRWSLDDKLSEILAEFEANAQAQEDRRIRRETENARLKIEWTSAREAARQAYISHVNANRLTKQLERLKQVADLRAYAELVRAASAEHDTAAREKIEEWARFIESQARDLDPLTDVDNLAFVTPDKVTDEDLKPFMPPGMSPYRPPESRV